MLFAREAIQNSWDAARELRAGARPSEFPPFHLEIEFRHFVGEEKRRFVAALGLSEHRAHFGETKQQAFRRKVGLGQSDCLDDLHDLAEPLRVLVYTEHCALGMEGAWDASESRMMFALNRVGYTKKQEGAGGSYGYGKAGLIAASKVRIVFAYSSFKESPARDDHATRRLLGVTYWSNHEHDGRKLTGWAHRGLCAEDGDIRPFEDAEADRVAVELGLRARSPEVLRDRGTTFLVVEPTIEAAEMKSAIERNWWPAIRSTAEPLRVRITDYDGTEMVPQVPIDDADLGPFVRGFDLATRPPDGVVPTEQSYDLGSYSPHGGQRVSLGRLGLVADDKGWSFPDHMDEDDEIEHTSMVALVRGPHMIVEYHKYNLGMPFIRGCFVAHDDVDDLLRQTEPAAHDKWHDSVSADGISPMAPKVAREVIKEIKERVKEFKRRFVAPPPRAGELNLPILDELSRLMKGRKPMPPPPNPRTVQIGFVTAAHAIDVGDDHLVCRSAVEVSVADWVWAEVDDVSEVEVTVILSVAYVEDEAIGERLNLRTSCSHQSFVESRSDGGRFVWKGRLGRVDTARFDIETAPYSADWSVKFSPSADVTSPTVGSPRGNGSV
jgi:hypothetical protein